MSGKVEHHANHIIGYTGGQNPQPIYCSGHSVTGAQSSGVSKFKVGGKPAAVETNKGTTDCACDGQGYTVDSGSSKFKVGGKPIARVGDSVDIHGHGTGKMTSGLNKFRVK